MPKARATDSYRRELYAHLGGRVRYLRRMLNLTQDELAEDVGVSRATLSMIERGKQRVPVDLLLSLADALEGEPDDFLRADA